MENKKMPIDVIIEDNEISVRCAKGDWHIGELDNRWLWVLSAIANPGEHSINIKDQRKNRQDHQPDMTFSSEEKKEVTHMLCEEWEGSEGIREFAVLAVSQDKDALKQLLKAKVEKDEYGFIANNGIDDISDTHMTTNFQDGFVEYYILEEPVLTRKQTLEKLNTPEFDTSFPCPDNLKEIITPHVKELIEEEGCTVTDPEKAAAMVMEDKKFHSEIKESWWGTLPQIDEGNEHAIRAIHGSIEDVIGEKLEEDPDWFVNAGAAERYVYPENLQNILVDAVYNVSRDFNLPVYNAFQQAEEFMRDTEFNALFKGVTLERIDPDTMFFTTATCVCTDYVRDHIVPTHKREAAQPKLDVLLKDAKQRQETQAAQQKTVPEKGR